MGGVSDRHVLVSYEDGQTYLIFNATVVYEGYAYQGYHTRRQEQSSKRETEPEMATFNNSQATKQNDCYHLLPRREQLL